MIAVSSDFKTAMKQPVKELDGYIMIAENDYIRSSDNLISFKISCEAGMCKTGMRKMEAKYLGNRTLLDQWINIGFGVRLPNGTFEYMDYGSFLVTEITYDKETETTSIVGYDKMINAMKQYSLLNIEYPISLYDYTKALCEACNLELANETFVNADWEITQELWENIEGITYRDILVQIAQVTASTCIISNDKICFKYINETGEELTYDNMKSLKLDPKYGEINSVILSRVPQEDNVYLRNEESIEVNGLTEFKIENNEIVDKDRENAITPIYETLLGINYYPFETNTEGLGWYEIADKIDIIDNNDNVYPIVLFNYSINIDGGIQESLKTSEINKTQTQYQYAVSIGKRLKNTEIIVNKQENYIQSLTESIEIINDDLNENYYSIEQTNELLQTAESGVTNTFSTSGGNNLIRNSALLFEETNSEGNYEYWEGSLLRTDDEDKSETGTAILIQNVECSQTIETLEGDYFLSFKYKKLIELSTLSVFLNGIEYQILNGDDEIDENQEIEYELQFKINNPNITISFVSNTNNGVKIYDLMLNKGTVKAMYSQHQNEITTNTVRIGKGIQVESSLTNTITKIDADGQRTLNKTTGEVVNRNTDTGTYTKDLECENTAKINRLFIQEVDEQVWITGL